MKSIETIQQIIKKVSELPKQEYKINVWIDGITYHSVDLDDGEYFAQHFEGAPCGCCSDYVDKFGNIADLSLLEQFEILIEIYEKYCI